jgi:hypothetical protein
MLAIARTARRSQAAKRSPVRSVPRENARPLAAPPIAIEIYDSRRFVCGDQSGRTSAPTRPHAVHTMLGHNDRTGVSSGSQSAFMMALWLHQTDSQ